MSLLVVRRVGARVPLQLLRCKKDAAAAAAPAAAAAAAVKKPAASAAKSGGAPARKETVRASARFFRELNEESEYTSDTDQPFAGNPEFRRQRPLSDATKEKVFQLVTGNATENPPRKVAARYGISIERVEAIVRMKQLERKMADEGFAVDSEFTKSMEAAYAATDAYPRGADEDDANEDTPYLMPNYLLLQEREPVPAHLQHLASGMAETAALDAAAPPAQAREKPSPRPAQVLATDKALAGGRFDFVFTTTNSDVPMDAVWQCHVQGTDVVVRDRTGVLRRIDPSDAGIRHGRPRPKKTHAP